MSGPHLIILVAGKLISMIDACYKIPFPLFCVAWMVSPPYSLLAELSSTHTLFHLVRRRHRLCPFLSQYLEPAPGPASIPSRARPNRASSVPPSIPSRMGTCQPLREATRPSSATSGISAGTWCMRNGAAGSPTPTPRIYIAGRRL